MNLSTDITPCRFTPDGFRAILRVWTPSNTYFMIATYYLRYEGMYRSYGKLSPYNGCVQSKQ